MGDDLPDLAPISAAGLAVASPVLVPRVLGDSRGLLVAAVVAVAGAAAVYLLRGLFAGERRFGSFQRSFRLPEDVDRDKIEATFKNGVLVERDNDPAVASGGDPQVA